MRAYIKDKAYYDKKANASKLIKKIICMFHRLRQTTREAKLPSENFGGLGLTILKRPHQMKIIWFAKIVQTKHKRCIVRDNSNSHPNNPYPMYNPGHENENRTRSLYARVWECDYEKLISKYNCDNAAIPNSAERAVGSYSPTDETTITQGTSREGSPELFSSPRQTDYVTERKRSPTWNLMRKQVGNNPALFWSSPVAQNTTFVTIRNHIDYR